MIQIKVNNEFIDVTENLSLTIQNSIENSSSITERSFKHTYTIAVENNSENRRIFGYIDPKKTGNFNQLVANTIEIFSDGTQIFDGLARITELTKREIKFFCISNESSWVQDIQGNLKDLDFGTGYTFYGSRPSGPSYPSNAVFVKDFWTGNTSQGITTNEILQFPLISYGNFYISEVNLDYFAGTFFCDREHNFSNNNTIYLNLQNGFNASVSDVRFQVVVTSPVTFELTYLGVQVSITNAPNGIALNCGYATLLNSSEYFDVGESPLNNFYKYNMIQELELEDIPPCVNIKKTIEGIFDTAGWRVNSPFMESDKFKNLYLTYSGKDDPSWNWGIISRTEILDTNIPISTGSPYYAFSYNGFYTAHIISFIDSEESVDYFNSYSEIDGYVAPRNGKYNINIEITGSTDIEFVNTIFGPIPDQRNIIYLAKRSNKLGPDDFEQTNNALTGVIDVLTAGTTNITSNLQQNENIIFYVDTNWYNASQNGYTGNTTFPYIVPTTGATNFGTYTGTDGPVVNSKSLRTDSAQVLPAATPHQYRYFFSANVDFKLKKGERIKLSNSIGGYNISLLSESNIENISAQINYIENEDGSEPEMYLRPENMMPDMSQVDFLKSVLIAFNMYSVSDQENKTIFFDTRDQFILPSHFSLDFSEKEYDDLSIYQIDISKNYTFSWLKDEKDIWTRSQNNVQDGTFFSYGDGEYSFSVEQINAQGDEKIIPLKFGYCAERIYNSLISGTGSSLFIPTMMSKDQEMIPQRNVNWTFDYIPKIIEWNGMRSGRFIFDEEMQSTYPYAASTNSTGFTLTWVDKNLYSGVINSRTKGMFSTFYENQINEYKNSEVTEITFIIDTMDFNDLDTRRQIFWNECHYRVIDVTYTPTNRQAKIKMIKTNI